MTALVAVSVLNKATMFTEVPAGVFVGSTVALAVGSRAVIAGDAQVDLLDRNASLPHTRPGVLQSHCQRAARLPWPQGRMAGLIDELAVEAEVADEREVRSIVLEPSEAVHDEAQRDRVDADGVRRPPAERERPDLAWEHRVLLGGRDAVGPG